MCLRNEDPFRALCIIYHREILSHFTVQIRKLFQDNLVLFYFNHSLLVGRSVSQLVSNMQQPVLNLNWS